MLTDEKTMMHNIVKRIMETYPLCDEALEAMTSQMQRVEVPRNVTIVRSGDVSHTVYFIERGITRSVFYYDGNETTTWFSMEGDMTFGMDALYYGNKSVESIETLEPCVLYTLPATKLDALYRQYIDIANWGRVLHQDVNKMLSHAFVDRLQLTPSERYEQFLKRFPSLVNRVKLKYVADFLGISIYTLSRIRSNI